MLSKKNADNSQNNFKYYYYIIIKYEMAPGGLEKQLRFWFRFMVFVSGFASFWQLYGLN